MTATESDPAMLVESVPQDFADALRTLGVEHVFAAGEALWREGAPAAEVALVLEGCLEVVREGGGEATSLRRLYPGAVAADAVVASPCATTLRACAASRVLLVPAARFRDALRQDVALLERLFWLQVRRARSLPWRPSRCCVVTDELTGLYHHGFFRERLAVELERAQQTGDTVVLAVFDVDRLAAFNAACGRAAGDGVLRTIGELLRKTGRRGDLTARHGDDEFATLLFGATASDGWRFAEAFRGAVMATGFPSQVQPSLALQRVTVSGGVASYPHDAQDETALVEAARARLSSAKQSGGNCTVGAAVSSR